MVGSIGKLINVDHTITALRGIYMQIMTIRKKMFKYPRNYCPRKDEWYDSHWTKNSFIQVHFSYMYQWNNFFAMRSISLSMWSWGSLQMNFCWLVQSKPYIL